MVLADGGLRVDETTTTPIVEIQVNFRLTPQQVAQEAELMTAVTLATRAANLLSQAEDVLIFQGQEATKTGKKPHPLLKDKKVHLQSGDAKTGLLNAQLEAIQTFDIDGANGKFGEKTFEGVADVYSRLQSGSGLQQAHYGPYALVLPTGPYADTYAPLANTLIMPADRIKPLVTEGFHGTGTLPEGTGILVSLGGNTMDLAVGVDATVAFLQEDTEGQFRFRVYERFALRLKDTSAIIKLVFNPNQP